MTVLFLYSEVAGYFLSCAEELAKSYSCDVHIVRWPVNPEAPFAFREYEGVTFHEREHMDEKAIWELYQRLTPSLVYVSGWMDKTYIKAAKRIKATGVPVVCGADNHWRGDWRQRIATLISPFFLKPRFTHMWVPGRYQYEFARRLGFAPNNILTGMYAADVAPNHAAYSAYRPLKAAAYPKNFLYVGRYVEVKGVRELIEAFLNLRASGSDWTLTLVGAGPLKEQLPQAKGISYRSFVQPEKLPELAKEAGCFILPSHNEPWGVALHEFAGAGLPIITSDVCGAATAFVRHGYNGFLHTASNQESLESQLRNITKSTDAQLLEMGDRSYELSKAINPKIWASTLMSLIG